MTASRTSILLVSMAAPSRHQRPDLQNAKVDHLDRHVEDDAHANIGDSTQVPRLLAELFAFKTIRQHHSAGRLAGSDEP
jgi:hypothetical protein